MDAADLDYRARTLTGCVPPPLVKRLLALGHEREVEFQAGRGEWFCALGWARRLGGEGRCEEALQVLAPYLATGWWRAAEAQAELLEGWGRAEEAIALVLPFAEAGDRLALVSVGRLLARHGRGGEAFELLKGGIGEWYLAACLVEVAAEAGRDEEVAALLEARIAAAVPACDDPECGNVRVEPSNAIDLLAAVRERQGRIDEAVALLHTRRVTSVNGRDQLADLLARHGRIEELRAYAATEHHGHAVRSLAEVLEGRGDLEAAIDVYRTFGAVPGGRWQVAVPLAELLARHGRGEEAIEVMGALADSPGGWEDWIVDTLCTLYADQGRAREALARLDAVAARQGRAEDWEFFRIRLWLMGRLGLHEEAIDLARRHPEGDSWYGVWSRSGLLAEVGRTEEALALLEQDPNSLRSLRAEYLVDLGRIEEAVRVHQEEKAVPVEDPWSGECSVEPPF